MVNFYDSMFPLPCFYSTIELAQTIKCLKGRLRRDSFAILIVKETRFFQHSNVLIHQQLLLKMLFKLTLT